MNTIKCQSCGGMVVNGKQKFHHIRRCVEYKSEGVDHVVCRECGYRSPVLSKHISLHELTERQYHDKYPGAPLVLKSIVKTQRKTILAKSGYKPIAERRLSAQCNVCGDWFVSGGEERHLRECIVKHPDKYVEGKNYVRCKECGLPVLFLGQHLRKMHGWTPERITIAKNNGLHLTSMEMSEKKKTGRRNEDEIRIKREQTTLDRYGVTNAFASSEKKEKIRQTNQKRYGVDHPMQNAEVFTRQQKSAQNGPSGQELFFMEHVISPNVVYTGYGGRFIRTKTGVKKYGRIIKDLNPDFMVLPDNVLESAISASRERRKLDNLKHRTKYVIELLGDWYHSEAVIGVPQMEHERQVVEAYKSAGIECLVLWEHDVLNRWNAIEPMVNSWIQKAVSDINANPVWKKATKNKVDGRLATFLCPYGSGRKFKTAEQLETWKIDPLNFWRPEMVEGKDYVRCLECENVRVGKVVEHLRRLHPGMDKTSYLERHPGALLVSSRISELVAENNKTS